MGARITVWQRRKITEELKVQVRTKKGAICYPLHVESLVELDPETWSSDCQHNLLCKQQGRTHVMERQLCA